MGAIIQNLATGTLLEPDGNLLSDTKAEMKRYQFLLNPNEVTTNKLFVTPFIHLMLNGSRYKNKNHLSQKHNVRSDHSEDDNDINHFYPDKSLC